MKKSRVVCLRYKLVYLICIVTVSSNFISASSDDLKKTNALENNRDLKKNIKIIFENKLPPEIIKIIIKYSENIIIYFASKNNTSSIKTQEYEPDQIIEIKDQDITLL